MEEKKQKVAVAMSGGVDSSVAVALLKEQGYEVFGVFMHFWSDPARSEETALNKCCSVEAQEDARRVANELDIPLYTINLEQDFKDSVVDNFLEQYKKGLTPNPCVRCNKFIKLGLFIEKARAMGADLVATGHYAINKKARKQENKKTDSDFIYHLLRGKDESKDQSYFLYNLTQEKLAHILFPIGEFSKPKVREMAKKFNLPVFEKSESQEICFVPGKTHYDFLKRYLYFKKGDIVTLGGEKVGEHEGLPLYTIGQRKGIGIGGVGPFYVVKADYEKNELVVTDKADESVLYTKRFLVKNVNWISGEEPELPLKAEVKIRYGHKAQRAIMKEGGEIEFEEAQRAVTAGQSAVFYNGDEVLGGGIIDDFYCK